MLNLFNKIDPNIGIKERSPAFYKAAERVAKYMETLSLSEKQISKLLKLFAEQIHEAEVAAACQGIKIGTNQAIAELQKQIAGKVGKNGKRNGS